MPMPRPPATHHKNMATKNAFQVKKKRAAIAPMWKATMKKLVTQTTGCVNVLSCLRLRMGMPFSQLFSRAV